MMNSIALLALFFSTHSFAQTQLTSELKPLLNGQTPALEVKFAHDEALSFFISVYIKGSDLTDGKPFNSLSYRYQDAATGKYLSEWKLYEESVTPTRLSGSYLLQASSTAETGADQIRKSLRTLTLLVLINEATQPLLKTFSFGPYCQSHPELFKDFSTGLYGCDTLVRR